jgi:hypothetical protein
MVWQYHDLKKQISWHGECDYEVIKRQPSASVMAEIIKPEIIKRSKALAVNPVKMSQPLGVSLIFLGALRHALQVTPLCHEFESRHWRLK